MEIEQIEELLIKIQQLQSMMIAVATGESKIQYKQKEYTQLYKDIAERMEFIEEEGVFIKNPNEFKSLSNWRNYWSSNLKSGYASKAGYIHDLYASVFEQIDIILCQHYVKDKSQQELVDEWQISRFEELKTKIQKLQEIMISVATQGEPVSLIKYEEEGYKKLYREIILQISILRQINIAAPNPNQFRSLWQWYNYWSFQLDNLKTARQEHIDNLYKSVLKPIDRALKQYPKKLTSAQEVIQDLQRRFNQTTSPITTAVLSETLQKSPKNLDENLEKETLENIQNTISIPLPQGVDNFLFHPGNSNSIWTDENIMNPDIFLDKRDVTPLIVALNNFALKVNVASDRQNVLESAGIDSAFLSNLRFDTPPNTFALALVSGFKNYQISHYNFNYHPLVNLLESLRDLASIYGLKDQDVELFNRLVERGEENFKALTTRNAVCRIESPKGTGIGTGVLVGKNLLLTCNHIFSKTQVRQAWVRFNYNVDSRQLDKDLFELDMTFVSYHNRPDYALVKIKGNPQQQIAIHSDETLDSGQDIRIIHHPQGKPMIISDLGQIIQVGEAYIDHNVKTDEGSSGAPIFNRQWELIAIHQGNPGIGRTVTPGSTGGIPIRAIWNQISSYLG